MDKYMEVFLEMTTIKINSKSVSVNTAQLFNRTFNKYKFQIEIIKINFKAIEFQLNRID